MIPRRASLDVATIVVSGCAETVVPSLCILPSREDGRTSPSPSRSHTERKHLAWPRSQRGKPSKEKKTTIQNFALVPYTNRGSDLTASHGGRGRNKEEARSTQEPGYEPSHTSRASGSAPGSQSWTATITGVLSSEAVAATTSSASPDKPPAAATSCSFSLKRVWRGPVRARKADERSKGQSTAPEKQSTAPQQQQQHKEYPSQGQSTRRHER